MTAMTDDTLQVPPRTIRDEMIAFAVMALLLAIVPLTGVYPFFVMQALCFALLACAFNLLVGYGGLLSFGHAMFLGTAGYCTAHALKVWGLPPELGIIVGVAGACALKPKPAAARDLHAEAFRHEQFLDQLAQLPVVVNDQYTFRQPCLLSPRRPNQAHILSRRAPACP